MTLQAQTLEQLQEVLDAIREERAAREERTPAENGGQPAPETIPTDVEEDDADDLYPASGADLLLDAAESAAPPRTRSRRSVHRGSDWNPAVTRRGTDRVQVSVPAGFAFDHYDIRPIETSFPYELRATSAPRRGSTTDGTISVNWQLWGQGVVSYRITTVCVARGATSVVRVEVGSDRWFERALHLANQRQPFKLVLTGADATRLWRALKPHVADTDQEIAVETAITIAIVVGVITVAGFALIGVVLTAVIENGCNATTDFTAPSLNGLSPASLSFDVTCREGQG